MENYDIRYDDKYGQLTHIDLAAEGAAHPGIRKDHEGARESRQQSPTARRTKSKSS
jgi:hypothetical protein